MTEQEKSALVEWLRNEIALIQSAQDEIPFGLDYDGENTLKVFNIALAALTAEPVASFILIDDVYQQLADEYRESPDAKPLYAAPTQ